MGLRLGEALNLKVGDVDGARMQVHVRCAKGRRDRFVTLPVRTLLTLRQHWGTHGHPHLLFPTGKTNDERHRAKAPMDRRGLQASFKAIVHSCSIRKHITIHSLRHCYGAHLVEAGVNLRAIQHQLGHQSPTTTALYTQLTEAAHQDVTRLINGLVDELTFTLEENE
jgi:integrase/recombinase XerD